MGSIHQNGDRLREPKVGDTRRPAAGPGSRRWVDRLRRQHEGRVLHLSDDYLSLSKSASDPSMWTPNVLRSFLVGAVAWKTDRNHWGLSFFRAWHVAINHRSSISIAGPSIVLVHALWTPRTLFFVVVVSAVLHFTSFPFFFFFLLYSSVAQTLKNVGPLDCKLRLLRRRSQHSLGGMISVAEVMHLLTLNMLNVLSANYRVVLVVVAFFFLFFFHSFSFFVSFFPLFSLWWLRTFFFFE